MWQGIYGHDDVVERFRRTLARGRLASTYLFVGPAGIGKRRFALKLARALLCTHREDKALEACGQCESCRLFAAGNHPDLIQVEIKRDKTALSIDQFIGEGDAKNEKGMCLQIALKPFISRRKIAVIVDADHFSDAAANCLLKTLEEPPADSLIILIGTSQSRQLPTIRSRAQLVRFRPLADTDVARILHENGLAADPAQAARMAQLGNGSIERAVAQADPELWEFRQQLFHGLKRARERPDSARMARAVQAFLDEAGDEPAAKRERLRMILSFALDFYREGVGSPWRLDSAADGTDHQSQRASDAGLTPDVALRAADRSLIALEQIDRNANLGLLMQAWCEDLTDLTMARG